MPDGSYIPVGGVHYDAFSVRRLAQEISLLPNGIQEYAGNLSSAPALGAADWNKLSMQTKTGRRAKHDAREAVLIEENPESAEMIQINVVHRQQTMESLCGAPLRRESAEQIAVRVYFQRRALQK